MNINQFIKGIIVGIAKIIPGLSGAVLMISFNLYDKAINSITNFFDNPKRNFLFLINFGFGVVLGIVLFSKVIHFLITNYYLYITCLFLGLIIGGIPVIAKKVPIKGKYFMLIILSFSLVSILTFFGGSQNYVLKNTYIDLIVFFISGLLEAVGTVLPGVSSTALLMLMGIYNHYLLVLSRALNFNYLVDTLRFILPFTTGMLIGVIILSILINYLFKNYCKETFAVILGLSISSCVLLGKGLIFYISNIWNIIISLIMLLIGYFITNRLD